MAFIVITGGDKCGKTTQCNLLVGKLRSIGVGVCSLSVPDYDSPVGETIKRRLFEGCQSSPNSVEALDWRRSMETLHIVDKLLVADKIAEAQRQGCIVVCSRWYESAKAYAEANGFEEEWHESLIYNLPHPDLTILLDIGDTDYKARLRRLGEDGLDKYETNREMQVRVRESMREWASNSQTRLVDGSRTQDEVALAVWQIVEQKLLAMAALASCVADADRELLKLVHRG